MAKLKKLLGEESDWFDKVSVNRNMKALKGNVMEFTKTAKEAHMLNQRLTALYEDIGSVLNRYYDIDEEIVDEKLDAVGKEDSDVDNDGDTDSSDEYLKKRRAAISKAMKKEDINMSELEKAVMETAKQHMKKPTKKFKDIDSNLVTPKSIGYFKK